MQRNSPAIHRPRCSRPDCIGHVRRITTVPIIPYRISGKGPAANVYTVIKICTAMEAKGKEFEGNDVKRAIGDGQRRRRVFNMDIILAQCSRDEDLATRGAVRRRLAAGHTLPLS